MKTLNIELKLYSFNELSENAKEKAISKHGEFLDNMPEEYENENGELVEEYILHEKDQIIESIEMNDYLFFESGKLANVTTYTGKHKKAGISELIFKGKTYKI